MPGFTTGSDLNPEFRRRRSTSDEWASNDGDDSKNGKLLSYEIGLPSWGNKSWCMCLQGTALPTKIQIPVTGLSWSTSKKKETPGRCWKPGNVSHRVEDLCHGTKLKHSWKHNESSMTLLDTFSLLTRSIPWGKMWVYHQRPPRRRRPHQGAAVESTLLTRWKCLNSQPLQLFVCILISRRASDFPKVEI